jgi:L-lactate dehydrogenase complex protein LldG
MVNEAFCRLASADTDLVTLFARNATGAKMHVHVAEQSEVTRSLVAHLGSAGHRSALLTRSPLFDRLGLLEAVRAAGIDARYWDESTLDASYEVDVGITDVWAAVAETGSLVVRSSARHGRAVSLVPPHHVAVVERAQIVPDLIDLMHKIDAAGTGSGVVIITGPSKTADIEMNLVVGVHGPGSVEVFLI